MKPLFALIIGSFLIGSCKEEVKEFVGLVIGSGQMPNVVKDDKDNLHIVYGNGDSIMYSFSTDHGESFASPVVISVLPKLAASHMRGPQITATGDGISVIACNNIGDIFSYRKDSTGIWSQKARVNDADTVAKEGLMALSADKQNAFAAWLDLRDGNNKIFGARSDNGGKTWSKNIMIYSSPDTTVCECCKPSVAVSGNNIYVMFRNWLNGNRDMYLIRSTDGGNTFGKAEKLGNGSWALDGCPMDGGGLAISNNETPQTVWRRKTKLYSFEPGKKEMEIGEGKNCTVESVNGQNVYAWTEKGEIIILNADGTKKNLGKGQLPLLKAINNEHIICVWEKEKKIRAAVLDL